jgi:hypothetical protein
MPADDGNEPVADSELLYRRIPVSKEWYSAGSLSPEAFDPLPDETTGISIYRAKYKSLEEAAKGKSKKGYYVAEFRAGDLRKYGIEIDPRPQPDDPGHAELPSLNCLNRLEPDALERKLRLAHLPQAVHGPFLPPRQMEVGTR